MASYQYPGEDYNLRHRADYVFADDHHWQKIGRDNDRFYAIGASLELAGCTSPILQIREVAMMFFFNGITDKKH
jgi:hypothetical protein